jgi:bifunctional DNase/RNase
MPSVGLTQELRVLVANDARLTDRDREVILADADPGKLMEVVAVRVETATNQPLLVLRETHGERYLVSPIGEVEATAITYALQGVTPAVPLTHDLFGNVLDALAVRVDKAHIHACEDHIYITTLRVNGKLVRARTSDVAALLLRTPFPLYASEQVLSDQGIDFVANYGPF